MNINQFFQPEENNLTGVSIETALFNGFLLASDAFSRTAYNSVYIIDVLQKTFLYVSDNPLFLCGHTASRVTAMGYRFFLKQVPKKDLELLFEINNAGVAFFSNLTVSERLLYCISYDFHLIQANQFELLINHKVTPLILEADGSIRFVMCVVSISSQKKAGNLILRKKGESFFYVYSQESKTWQKHEEKVLTEPEKLILHLSAQGNSMKTISQRICLSPNTIKYHKRNIFQKLEVGTISEAISTAINHSIL